jgi:endonuclease-3
MKKEEPKSPKTPQKQKPSTQEQKRKTPKSKTTSGRKRQRIEPGSLPLPKNYELVYPLVEELRADRTAPLDTDGGEALPERHLGDKVYRYQVLIALMLSSQTKDAVVGESIRALQEHGLDVETIGATDPITLNSLIRKVGFHNNKTKYIKNTTDILKKDYDGDIPPTAEAIMKLPGVGPKMVRKLTLHPQSYVCYVNVSSS